MSEDPISKSKIGAGMGSGDPVPKNQGRGSINTSRDFSTAFTSLSSRVAFVSLCMLPYVVLCVYLYLSLNKFLAIILLSLPILVGLGFWLLSQNMRQ